MTTVPERVLNWLYGSLQNEYRNVDRTYYDIAQTLARHQSLTPRTEIFTYENGSSALLVNIHGTLPVPFRGVTYRFPITIWMPYSYPHDPPLAYIAPNENTIIRPGQHVGAEGRIYHPYLAHWANHWDKSNVLDLLAVLQDVFGKEPPVMSKPHDATRNSEMQQSTRPPPVPPTPWQNDSARGAPAPHPQAPPPPPKPPEAYGQHFAQDGGGHQRQPRAEATVPTLPPKPDSYSHTPDRPPDRQYGNQTDLFPQHMPLPPRHNVPIGHPPQQRPSNPGEGSSATSPNISSITRHMHYRTPELPNHSPVHIKSWQPQASMPASEYYPGGSQMPQELRSGNFVQRHGHPSTRSTVARTPKVALDLLSAPLESQTNEGALDSPHIAPPIPPNPERDGLLRALAAAFRMQYGQIVSQHAAAVPALAAQLNALERAHQAMLAEQQQLKELNDLLTTNEKILHKEMQDADRLIESVQRKKLPSVDDVLVAPTTVGEQLYRLVAEEKSTADALFVLSRALDKGRLSGDVFAKQTRSLAREQFLKKALIKKIAEGMGLDIGVQV